MLNHTDGPAWVYRVDLGKWVDVRSGQAGLPRKGDAYSDAGEWRVW